MQNTINDRGFERNPEREQHNEVDLENEEQPKILSPENQKAVPGKVYIPLSERKSVDIIINSMKPLNEAISEMSEIFFAELPKVMTKGERLKLKMTFRSCINRIEYLYEQI